MQRMPDDAPGRGGAMSATLAMGRLTWIGPPRKRAGVTRGVAWWPAAEVRMNDDAALVARLRAGEEAAFAELVRAQHGRLLRLVRGFCRGNRATAEDVVQEVWVAVLTGLDRYHGRSAARRLDGGHRGQQGAHPRDARRADGDLLGPRPRRAGGRNPVPWIPTASPPTAIGSTAWSPGTRARPSALPATAR